MPETSTPCRIGMSFSEKNGRQGGLRRACSGFRIRSIRHISADSEGDPPRPTASVRQSEWAKNTSADVGKIRKYFCGIDERVADLPSVGMNTAGRVRRRYPDFLDTLTDHSRRCFLTRPSTEVLLVPLGPSDPVAIRAARPLGHAPAFLGWAQHRSLNGGKVQLLSLYRSTWRRFSTSSDHA